MGFRAINLESGFGFKEKRVNSDSRFLLSISPPIQTYFAAPTAFYDMLGSNPNPLESGFGFKAVRFGFGFKKKGVDSDSAGFGFKVPGFRFGFEMLGFANH